jgi:hypothetical protein
VDLAAGYATFIAPFNVSLANIKVNAYTVDGVEADGATLTLTKVEGTVPANTPVVLESETVKSCSFGGISVATETAYTAGLLTGVYAETDAPVGSYVLQNQQTGGLGFYKVADAKKVPAYHAYLTYTAPEAKAFFFPGNEATAIESIAAMTSGQVEAIYSANGAKLQTLQKGLNIVKMQDGTVKKILVK